MIFEHNDIDIDVYLPELYRVLADNSHCYIMTNNLNIMHFLEVIGKSGFHFVKNLIWDKCNKICGKYYMGQYEYIILLRKGADRPINNCSTSDLLSVPNVKHKNIDGTNIHDSQKPVELMRTLVENSTNKEDVVLDCFMGSGSTGVAALESDRKFIGIEIDKKYFEIAKNRIEHCGMQMSLFV